MAQLFGSGSILNEALRAQKILAEQYQVAADVWSVTSYNELRREGLAVDRWNRLHPTEAPRVPYIVKALEGAAGPVIASSDYMKAVPDQLTIGGRVFTRPAGSPAASTACSGGISRFRPRRMVQATLRAGRAKVKSTRSGRGGDRGPRLQS